MAFGYLTPRQGALQARPATTGSLFDLHRQVNRLFDSLIEPSEQGRGGLGWPQVEIEQDDGAITVCAELPGVREEDVDLTIEDGVLTLAGEKKSERKDENGYSERSYGRFERRITLPSNIDDDACEAQFKDGVLTVTIPKCAEKQRGRRIPLGGRSEDRQIAQGGSEKGGSDQSRNAKTRNVDGGNDNASSATRQQAAEQSSRNKDSSGGGGQQG